MQGPRCRRPRVTNHKVGEGNRFEFARKRPHRCRRRILRVIQGNRVVQHGHNRFATGASQQGKKRRAQIAVPHVEIGKTTDGTGFQRVFKLTPQRPHGGFQIALPGVTINRNSGPQIARERRVPVVQQGFDGTRGQSVEHETAAGHFCQEKSWLGQFQKMLKVGVFDSVDAGQLRVSGPRNASGNIQDQCFHSAKIARPPMPGPGITNHLSQVGFLYRPPQQARRLCAGGNQLCVIAGASRPDRS